MGLKFVIVGAGVAGLTLALGLAGKGEQVTLVEKQDLGGGCMNRGCIPTKTYLHFSSLGMSLSELSEINLKNLKELRTSLDFLVKNRKIDYICGEAFLEEENIILVGNRKIFFDVLVVATGSEAVIPSPLRDFPNLFSSESIFGLKELPADLIIVGGGYQGVEFATIFGNLGSRVSLVEKKDHILPEFDKDVSLELSRSLESRGVNLLVSREIVKSEGSCIHLSSGEVLSYSHILVCSGRKPFFIKTKLDFEFQDGVVKCDENFQTSIKNIYCIGDSSGGPLLANKAEYDAKLLLSHLECGSSCRRDYSHIPFCVFSEPQIAVIPPLKNFEKVVRVDFSFLGKAFCDGSREGFLKLYLDVSQRIIGAQVVNKNAVEIISVLIPIVANRMTCEEVEKMIFVHPTSAEIILEAANLARRLYGSETS